ncbi:hypothetical protein I79_020496 [Cricetulus griseus]|uniref:Uncharacterized protein n=1 Tax=Cricetulus griseus TaxID=10029 RepID=G3IA79_CRIGR|nr:hypothetical protein I79_020496 [Cricetulus griseus]
MDLPEPELQMIVSCCVSPLEEQPVLFSSEPSLQLWKLQSLCLPLREKRICQ